MLNRIVVGGGILLVILGFTSLVVTTQAKETFCNAGERVCLDSKTLAVCNIHGTAYDISQHCEHTCSDRMCQYPVVPPTPTCTAEWKCRTDNWKSYQRSDCSWTGDQYCQYGCSDGVCESVQPLMCTAGWKCIDSNRREYQYSDCSWTSQQFCQYGCSSGVCNSAPTPTCTVGWICKDTDTKAYKYSDCSWGSSVVCQYGCSDGVCKSAPNYLEKTFLFDYTSSEVVNIGTPIDFLSETRIDKIKTTAQWTYNNIRYEIQDLDDCKTTPASKVIKRGYGTCTTMSHVNIAILRGMGIEARPAGGCLFRDGNTQFLSIFSGSGFVIGGGEDVENGRVVYQRDLAGAHGWVEVLTNEGWVILESTSGNIYKSSTSHLKYDGTPITPTEICSTPKTWYDTECVNA